jgi:DNA primase
VTRDDKADKHSIGPVFAHYGGETPRATNRWVSVRCPFHGDHTASAAINLEENAFACYACDIKGDTYAVIMQHEGIGFREAYQRAEDLTGESRQIVRGFGGAGGRLSRHSRSHLGRSASSRFRSR